MPPVRVWFRDNLFLVVVVIVLLIAVFVVRALTAVPVTIKVVDKETGKLVKDARVRLRGYWARIDRHDRFQAGGVPTGTVKLTVRAWGYKSVQRRVDINSNLDRLITWIARALLLR